ncbi:hypothetical protein NP233_g5086 [Leucocoprinus birnbaumii]|uniref:Uncharacterized protein n=1 Tax=Leucocoprinus birnbaumii TaxID=56174 RepID=A0AAD5YRA0_9AGAR|nr:hypothetical protein NP233_g5086 [Leucocoprinus birnbaumii]
MVRVNGFTIQNSGQAGATIIDPFSQSHALDPGATSDRFSSLGSYQIRGPTVTSTTPVNLFTVVIATDSSGGLTITPQGTAAAAAMYLVSVEMV